MSPGKPDPTVVNRHLLALRRAVSRLALHADFTSFADQVEQYLRRI